MKDEFIEALNEVEGKSMFGDWKKANEDFYLVHGLLMVEKDKQAEWQIGYYSQKKDRIITISSDGDSLAISPESEVFKKEDTINPLDIQKIKISKNRAVEAAEEIRKKDYSSHLTIKTIIVVQNIGGVNQWNISFIANSFNILNIKLDSESAVILKTELIQFKDLYKRDTGK